MKRNFTRILAAFALLVGLAIPMGVWGQSTVTFDATTDITENASSYQTTELTINAADGSTWTANGYGATAYTNIIIGKGGANYLRTPSVEGTITSVTVTWSGNTNYYLALQTTTGTELEAKSNPSEPTTETYTVSGNYSQLQLVGRRNSGTSNAAATITNVVVTYTPGSVPQPTTYTVTYNANITGISPIVDTYNEGDNVTLRAANTFTNEGYAFSEWNTQADGDGDAYEAEGTIEDIQDDIELYAIWTENTTPSGTTATLNIQAYAEANSWENGVKYTTATVAPVTFTANGGGNTGKYYESGHDWRFYQGESASITISVPEGYTLVSITPTYSVSNGGVLKNGNVTIASGTTVNVSGTSVTFTVGNSGSATNGQVRFTNIDVVYVSDGGTQTASDLTITNQSTDLTFDLYNNTTAQVISYTTSSTGAITITPTESDYFSYVHDAAAKTITVTPTAVTPSAQTVTISQAADDDYYAGTATFTVTVANSDPNLPGTENNPYTVAQARAAIDANSGTQGVYATGVVSEIVTEWSTQYNNITFNFVDEEGDEDFLQAYRCASGTGVDASQVAVGDVVVVYGNLTKYGSTYEFGQGCQLVSLTSSGIPSITADNVNLAAGATSGSIAYTINNPATNGTMAAETSSDWLTLGVGFDSPIAFTCTANTATSPRTATVTLTYTYNTNQTVTKDVTINQAAYEAPTYAELPFAFNGGKADIEGTDGLSQEGLGSDYNNTDDTKLKFDDTGDWLLLQFNERPGALTFKIKGNSFSGGTFKVQTSEDGTNYTDLATYTSDNLTSTVNSEEFTDLGENVRYIKWIYTNKVSGNVGLGNITLGEYVAPQPSITVETNVINVDAESHQEFLNVNFVNFEPTTGNAFTCDANGTFTDYSWLVAELDINNNRVRYTIGNNEEVARTGYFRVKCGDVYSEIVTVNQAAYVPPFEPATYIPATEINPDKRYIIVGFNDGDAYAMGYQKTNNRDAVGISMNGTTALVETSDVYEFILAEEGDGYTIYDERTPGYLYAASSSSNLLKTEVELDVQGNGVWSISFTEEPGQFNIVAFNSSNRNVMQFNQGSSLFSCYETASQSPVYLYEKVEDAEYTLEITGYTVDSEKTGYHLIASPVFVDPYLVGMADGDFDLYSFDQSEEEEWRNYEAGSFTMLEPGKGYLYAKKATDNVQTYYFNLSGTPYVGDGYIDLAYDANEGVSFPGLNLIGNPFGEEATLNIPYYRMNSTGSGLEAVNETESPVNVMEGVFVYAEYNSEYGYVTNYAQFTPNGNTSGGGGMKINLTRNRGTAIDNAIVRFDEGQQLPKFQLFENNTKLYIPQGNKDFAIVRSAAQGEMPVSFRASENGTYTIAVEAENVDMNYLHLIDNMTGADVDLLATPNYTFEARTNDYTSRFRLVFSANGIDEQTAETFAFFNGTSWTVSNTGDATLQVVDITGRIISSETINGNATISLNQPAGIYMLRLVNGNDVKVQKVVVR